MQGSITSYRDFTNTSILYFDKKYAEKKKLCQLVPHCLTTEQKQKCLEKATLLKQIFNAEGLPFLFRIVAVDETLVRDFKPELKSQSNKWRSPTSPCPKKFRRVQSSVKQMIFAYYHRGIIMTERVPCGTSVTAAYYRDWVQKLCIKIYKTDLTCSGMDHSFCTKMHACTWGRL